MTHIWAFGRGSAFCGESSPAIALSPTFPGALSLRSICPDCSVKWFQEQIDAPQRFEQLTADQKRGATGSG